MRRSLKSVILFAVVFPLATLAQPGALDTSFGEGGTVRLTPDPVAGANAVVRAEADQLLLAGLVGSEAAVLRLNADGSLDTTFGEEGYALLDLGGDDQFAGLAVRPDGSLVVSGIGGEGFAVVAGFTRGGALDASFGDGGTVFVSEGFESSQFTRLVLLPDGAVLAVGTAFPKGGENSEAIVARFTAEGALDPAFGTGGVARVALVGRGLVSQGIDVQADGRIIVGGFASGDFFAGDPFAVRLEADGSLDTSFGVQTFDFGASFSGIAGVLVDDAGRSVLVGFAADLFAGSSSLVLARLNTDGSLDESFGDGGTVNTTLGRAVAQGVAVTQQSDGKLLAAGPAGPDGATADLTVARFTSDGSLDAAFGDGGVASTDIAPIDIAASILLQPDGKVVVAGFENTAEAIPASIEVARFENDLISSMADEPTSPVLVLEAPYPNPASAAVTLRYTLAVPGRVRLAVYDLLGREVAVLAEQGHREGTHTAVLDGTALPTGTYLVRLQAGGRVAVQRLTVVR